MPNIAQVLGLNESLADGTEAEFDLDAFMADADKAVSESNDRQYAASASPAPVAPESSENEVEVREVLPTGEEGETEVEAGDEPVAEVSAPAPAAPAPSDPFSDISPERRAALLALHETLERDPAKAESVLRGLTSPASEPEPAPVATLPEDIDPQSFEATLWRQQQETNAQLSQLTSVARQQQETFAKQQAATAAQQAGAAFAARYVGKLEQADVLAIAQQAGSSGIAGVLASTEEGKRDLIGAYDRALETTLWGNEAFRQKVIGETPVIAPGEQPEAKDRKRKLTALSSAASPVSGPAPKRSPLESRDDGRLTPQSRMGLVQEMATKLARGAASDANL